MPIIREIKTDSLRLLVWKIEEPLSFFAEGVLFNKAEMEEFGNISYDSRKLEWLAARYVQRLLCTDSLIKDEWGKPHFQEQEGYVSIAHCKGYAAAIYSPSEAVGIDIEPIHDKVQRIAQKFLSQQELSFMTKKYLTLHYIVCWSIKEAIYKWYGKKELSFKKNIKIQKFEIQDASAPVIFSRLDQIENRQVSFEKLENIILAYT